MGGVSKHALRQTPPAPRRRLLLRAVRILLECILVLNRNESIFYFSEPVASVPLMPTDAVPPPSYSEVVEKK